MDPAVLDSRNGMVDFPSSGAPSLAADSGIPQHLPFRRISFPTSARNVSLRPQSVVSTASFDSDTSQYVSSPVRGSPRAARNRLSSVEASKRLSRRREIKSLVIDEQRDAKRHKIINEFYETERTYVEGLDLIYYHFLTPIIASLDTPNQLLDRTELTSVFSNFIDIWNLHRSFYSSFSSLMDNTPPLSPSEDLPPISPILLSHFPYLSLYTPFVSAFSDALSSHTMLLAKNPTFASFMISREADPRCGKLKFRDWLLTIVQRCPRYLLLLKDLISNTSTEDPEYAPLVSVHTLVAKITDSLNASLHVHAQTLELVAIQRSTANLPFQLLTPGRTFIRRGPLLQVVGSVPKEREFLLFSDCIIWLASADKDGTDVANKWDLLHPDRKPHDCSARPKTLVRTRSKSDADLPKTTALKLRLSAQKKNIKRLSSGGGEDRWVFKGRIDLVDLDVVAGAAGEAEAQYRFEILSPNASFALYADSADERDEWSAAIRNAKSSLLLSLNVMHMNSTLTSSASTNHLRHALQALPYLPDELESCPRRGRVEHFVPAVWIPDGKTESCMRCGRTFGWRRRRHHCRLCGRCVCATCSTKTFFIVDPTQTDRKTAHKSARACDACYDTVFPILDSPFIPHAAPETISRLTLSGLRSMPSLLMNEHLHASPSVLMTVDFESPRRAPASDRPQTPSHGLRREVSDGSRSVNLAAIRIKPPSRPRSYIHILQDFGSEGARESSPGASPSTSRFSDRLESSSFILNDLAESEEDSFQALECPVSAPAGGSSPNLPINPRVAVIREDTVRRRKRFSLPALAIHTTPVTTRPNVVGEGKTKRWSLVLGPLRGGSDSPDGPKPGNVIGKLNDLLRR